MKLEHALRLAEPYQRVIRRGFERYPIWTDDNTDLKMKDNEIFLQLDDLTSDDWYIEAKSVTLQDILQNFKKFRRRAWDDEDHIDHHQTVIKRNDGGILFQNNDNVFDVEDLMATDWYGVEQ